MSGGTYVDLVFEVVICDAVRIAGWQEDVEQGLQDALDAGVWPLGGISVWALAVEYDSAYQKRNEDSISYRH